MMKILRNPLFLSIKMEEPSLNSVKDTVFLNPPWVNGYTVETDDGEVLTAKQVKEFQKRNTQLEEENLILKKAIAIFTPHSNNDWMLFISCSVPYEAFQILSHMPRFDAS